MSITRFDSVLLAALPILDECFGDIKPEITLVRDTLGKLVVVLPDDALGDTGEWNALADKLHKVVGGYSPGKRRILLRQSDLIDAADILDSPDRIPLPEATNTWIIDRLLTNQDWLRPPLREHSPIPTAVAYSIKGGVGRTTAFAVWAWALARLGKKVLVIDLDLEAPGIGSVLLDRLPDYGLVDWLMESLVEQADTGLLQESLMESPLSADEAGTIWVLPAFGQKSRNYIEKLGRIYLPTLSDEGLPIGLAERLFLLIEQCTKLATPPDILLFDARAGLHDLGSAAVTRLGAEVFLFARDEYQTWQAYRQLFEHLRSSRGVRWGMPDEDLRWRLKMVGAQTEPLVTAQAQFVERSYETWLSFYDAEMEAQPQVFGPYDSNAPHYPLFIDFDPRIRTLNLIDLVERPAWEHIEAVFRRFYADATLRVLPEAWQENQ
jgi:hypothetical protein